MAEWSARAARKRAREDHFDEHGEYPDDDSEDYDSDGDDDERHAAPYHPRGVDGRGDGGVHGVAVTTPGGSKRRGGPGDDSAAVAGVYSSLLAALYEAVQSGALQTQFRRDASVGCRIRLSLPATPTTSSGGVAEIVVHAVIAAWAFVGLPRDTGGNVALTLSDACAEDVHDVSLSFVHALYHGGVPLPRLPPGVACTVLDLLHRIGKRISSAMRRSGGGSGGGGGSSGGGATGSKSPSTPVVAEPPPTAATAFPAHAFAAALVTATFDEQFCASVPPVWCRRLVSDEFGDVVPAEVHTLLQNNSVVATLEAVRGWRCPCCRARSHHGVDDCVVCGVKKVTDAAVAALMRLPTDLDPAFFAVPVRSGCVLCAVCCVLCVMYV